MLLYLDEPEVVKPEIIEPAVVKPEVVDDLPVEVTEEMVTVTPVPELTEGRTEFVARISRFTEYPSYPSF